MDGKRSKRSSDTELNSDNWDSGALNQEAAEPVGTWEKAEAGVLAGRKIRKVKRPAHTAALVAPSDDGGDAPAKANPFASIALVPAVGGAPASASGFGFGAPASSGFGGTPAPAGGLFNFGSSTSAPAAPAAGALAPSATGAPGLFSFGSALSGPAPSLVSFGAVPSGATAAAPTPATPASAPVFGGFGSGSTGAPAANAPPLGNGAADGPGSFAFGMAAASSTAAAPLGGTFTFGCKASSAVLTSAEDAAAPPTAAAPLFAFSSETKTSAPPATSAPATSAASALVATAAPSTTADAPADIRALNLEFLEALEAEWRAGMKSTDWSGAMRDYIAQREALSIGGATAAAPTKTLGGEAPSSSSAPNPVVSFPSSGFPGAPAPTSTPASSLFTAPAWPPSSTSLFPTPSSQPAPASAPAPAPMPAAATTLALAPSAEAGGGGDGDADVRFREVTKLFVYRQEMRSAEGELIQEKGWKQIGKGQLRLLNDAGVHFLEFRPEVSDGKATEDPEEGMEGKTRFGRPALSARLLASTKFDVNKKAVQVNLHSMNAAGEPVFARYYIALGDVPKAAAFAALAQSCCPAT